MTRLITTNSLFEVTYLQKAERLLQTTPINRGPAHATTDESMASTHELLYVTERFNIPAHMESLQALFMPNLPWAEDHFLERVGGEPLNPSPSEQWWPFARKGNEEHKKEEKFSHTYPERFWPRWANGGGSGEHQGIRFRYGDLNDLVTVLQKNPMSRQAYLPIWFPEDLAAAREGERVPCSMGYHFIHDGSFINCVYTMRSCDIVRFYRDDLYMAGRLLQYVAFATETVPGELTVHINNLHCFPGDRPYLEGLMRAQYSSQNHTALDRRANYNWDALG